MLASVQATLPKQASYVIANNDIVYLWWSFPEKIPNCLGFSIHRIVGDSRKALPASVGFSKIDDSRESPQTTDAWPIQSFNWKDLYAPSDKEICYEIIPMVGDWRNLKPRKDLAITTETVVRKQKYGDIKVIFNRGLLSTQAVSKDHPGDGANPDLIRKIIEDQSSEWRGRLAGQMVKNFNAFFRLAQEFGGKYYAALYELTDTELISLLSLNKDTEIILSNANGSEKVWKDGKEVTKVLIDKTNSKVREDLHLLMQQGQLKIYDRMLGTHIGHNKFVVYVDGNGQARSVLTGSTNWTATGLCGQTNNLVIVDDPELATKYLAFWTELKKDQKQGVDLRDWCRENSFEVKTPHNCKVWFSPNTEKKSKPQVDPLQPVDIAEVCEYIKNAKKSILYLVFNPGSPSIINAIQSIAKERKKQNPLFVRGAISDAALARNVVTKIVSTDASKRPDRYVVGDEQITGVASIPGTFSYWEKELLKLGFATIHDKIMVIDPFDDDCVVITGSHNLGYKASYTNDENMLIIKGNKPIAQAYAAHVLDVVNHFKWRYRLQSSLKSGMTEEEKREVLDRMWRDLDEKDKWQDYYFGRDGFINQYRLFLR